MKYEKLDKKGFDKLAKEIAKTLKIGDILLLHGKLGTGKTYFTNRLCTHLKVKTIINSPSYVLLNEYEGKFKIYHYDLYRLSTSAEAIELGILDRFKEGITIIEWPELIKNFIEEKCIEMYFEHNGEYRDVRL